MYLSGDMMHMKKYLILRNQESRKEVVHHVLVDHSGNGCLFR